MRRSSVRRGTITRRRFLQAMGLGLAAATGLGGYAVAIEPMRLQVTRYSFTPPGWTPGLKLRVAVLTDIHACDPWMGLDRLAHIVRRTNDLAPDLTLLLGDYSAGMAHFKLGDVHSRDWAPALAKLEAPLGRFAVLGNHDWWEDKAAQRAGHGPTFGQRALEAAGVPVLENGARRLVHGGRPFWVAGLGDQLALLPRRRYGRTRWKGVDDLSATLAAITDAAPVLMMAHEPDIFPQVPDRVSLTLAGHTHGGQVRLFGRSPVVPSRYGDRYAYGHIVEEGRHLLVSGGLGCSIAPIRFGVPPEIVLLELGQGPPGTAP